jgi:hypothetical protein
LGGGANYPHPPPPGHPPPPPPRYVVGGGRTSTPPQAKAKKAKAHIARGWVVFGVRRSNSGWAAEAIEIERMQGLLCIAPGWLVWHRPGSGIAQHILVNDILHVASTSAPPLTGVGEVGIGVGGCEVAQLQSGWNPVGGDGGTTWRDTGELVRA